MPKFALLGKPNSRAMNISSFCLKLGLSALLLPLAAAAQDSPEPERWNAKFQATYIRQAKPGFPAS